MTDKVLDVAIVGAGAAGAYAAWRLMEQGGGGRRVALFEASERVGGRLLSITPPGVPNQKAELGAMRFVPASQPRLAHVVETLGLETFVFAPDDPPENLAYLRGVRLRQGDLAREPGCEGASCVPYQLEGHERGKTFQQLLATAMEQIVPGITDPSLSDAQRREMARKAFFDGKPLYQQGFGQVAVRVLSHEAYRFILDTVAYESFLKDWNAADAMAWYLYGFREGTEFRGFRQGFQQVPLALAERFEQAGGEVHCNARLLGFDWKHGIAELRFRDRSPVRAKSLVLALPPRALELITPDSPLLRDEAVRKLVGSVTPRPFYKLFTTYETPWWKAAGMKTGRAVTDLPTRQTYYYPRSDGGPVTQGPAMLLAGFDDSHVGFWDSFRGKRGHDWGDEAEGMPRPEPFVGARERAGLGMEVDPQWAKHAAPAAMVREVSRQLLQVHGLRFTPEVQEAAFFDWGDDPYGGAWNNWNVGVKSWEVRERILQPVSHVPVYIIGDTFAAAQGWVEGALETADALLKKHFGLAALTPRADDAGDAGRPPSDR